VEVERIHADRHGTARQGRIDVPQLEHDLRFRHAAEANWPQLVQRHALWQARVHGFGHRVREQHLAPPSDAAETRAAVDHRPVVGAVAQIGLAGVQRHPHGNRPRYRPRLGAQRELSVQRCTDGRCGAVEDTEGGVALTARLHDHAAVPRHRLGQERVVASDGARHRLPIALPQARRSLDVGQQERDYALHRSVTRQPKRELPPHVATVT
jgi:hypothetical protein